MIQSAHISATRSKTKYSSCLTNRADKEGQTEDRYSTSKLTLRENSQNENNDSNKTHEGQPEANGVNEALQCLKDKCFNIG